MNKIRNLSFTTLLCIKKTILIHKIMYWVKSTNKVVNTNKKTNDVAPPNKNP